MLKFIGIGSAFTINLGNNSAYFLENNHLFLIDCGSNIFEKLVKSNILNNVEKLSILITHKHPDHMGSLGDLIYYAKFILNIKPNVYAPAQLKLDETLNHMGVYDIHYAMNLVPVNNGFISFVDLNLSIQAKSTTHFQDMKSYGYIFIKDDKKIYYSGDSNTLESSIYNNLQEYDFVYQDVSSIKFENNPHVDYESLLNKVEKEQRHKIYCMHLDNKFNHKKVINDGFKIVSISETFLNLDFKLISLKEFYSNISYLSKSMYKEYIRNEYNEINALTKVFEELSSMAKYDVELALIHFQLAHLLTEVNEEKDVVKKHYNEYKSFSGKKTIVEIFSNEMIHFNDLINQKEKDILNYLS